MSNNDLTVNYNSQFDLRVRYFDGGLGEYSPQYFADMDAELKEIERSAIQLGELHSAKLHSGIEGCLIGLAIGDALGAPVEFMDLQSIKKTYGPQGLVDLVGWGDFPAGSYTDDTQMSIATAIGCYHYFWRGLRKGIGHLPSMVHVEYLRWYLLQKKPHFNRAPGNTCLDALRDSPDLGKPAKNNSKGCGGVMRMAPLGLLFAPESAFEEGVECARLTHAHPTGYLSAGFLSAVISYVLRGLSLRDAIKNSLKILITKEGHEETSAAISKALDLASSDKSVEDSIVALGKGWIAEEALAISLFCSLRFSNDFKSAVIASINHSGDSDSTGCITGAIGGAMVGIKEIPEQWKQKLEDRIDLSNLAGTIYVLAKTNVFGNLSYLRS